MKDIVARANEKAKEVASLFEGKGYDVFIEPSNAQLPIDLGSYKPDLIAIKGDVGIVVEIKESLKRLPVKKFNEISKLVASHKGWKFALVTIEDDVDDILSLENMHFPKPEEIQKRIGDIYSLIGMKMYPSALLSLCIQIEFSLRMKANSFSGSLNLLSIRRIINTLYSDGALSVEQVELLNDLMKKRNETMHGLETSVTELQLKQGLDLLNSILDSMKEL